jgi:hypothetical protein
MSGGQPIAAMRELAVQNSWSVDGRKNVEYVVRSARGARRPQYC